MYQLIKKVSQSIRWRLGMSVAAPELEDGNDESIAKFYNDRITHCEFLDDPNHYEFPRASWVLSNVAGGSLLEVGCGNGGMTRLLAPKVDQLIAFDVSAPSLEAVRALELPNVTTAQGLIENFQPDTRFDFVVLSEVIEHLRKPSEAIKAVFEWLAPNGSLLITTPNGHWESDEHLHEFSLQGLSQIVSETECESFKVGYIRDKENRRRWLVATLIKADTEPAKDDFFDRKATARMRKRGSNANI